ncbi:MAG: hypothetical protein LUF04_04700 [Bacteroides sp.]|nr:hypothetical protein [Bacteroides sp.]
MQSLLTNIELDVRGLRYLVQLASENPDQRLCEVMNRRVNQLIERCLEFHALLKSEVFGEPSLSSGKEISPGVQLVLPDNFFVTEEDSEEMDDNSFSCSETLSDKDGRIPVAETTSEMEMASISEIKPILGETLRKRTSLIGSMSLNDSFRYSQELFDGDISWMNRILKRIEQDADSLEEALRIIEEIASDKEESEAMIGFQEWIRLYFDR